MPSAFSTGVSRCVLWRACTMSSAFSPIRTPPAILNAPIVIPKILKIRLPASANATSVIAHVHAPRRARTRRCGGESRYVMARKVGMTANGSTMKNTDVKMSSRSITREFIARSDHDLNDAVFPRLLGVVHRLVGAAQQVVGAGVRRGARHDADARRHAGCALEHVAQARDEALGGGIGQMRVRFGHQHPELVASQPPDDIRGPDRCAHRVRDESE